MLFLVFKFINVTQITRGLQPTECFHGSLHFILINSSKSSSFLLPNLKQSNQIPLSQVDDPVEALDAAAVEAALSLCEDPAVGGHPLTSPWESQTFKEAEPEPIAQQSASSAVTHSDPDPAGVQEEMEVLVEEATETEAVDEVTGEAVAPVAPDAGQSQDSEVKTEGEREAEGEGGMEETQQENRTPIPAVKCEGEDWVQPETVSPCLDSEDSSASAKDTKVSAKQQQN